MIKLFGWEQRVAGQVEERRAAELKLIRRTKYIELVNNLTKYVSTTIYCRVDVACRTDRSS